MERCPGDRELEEHVLAPRPGVAEHLRACASCAETARLLEAMLSPETREEAAALAPVRRSPRSLLRAAVRRAGPTSVVKPLWQRLPALRLPVAALGAAAACAVVLLWPAPQPESALAALVRGERPLEAALSDAPYAPYAPRRGAADESAFDGPLRTLLEAREARRPGAERALATLFLLRGGPGDAARVDQALARAGPDAEAENDRGAVHLARGEDLAALDAFERALRRAPGLAQARFNRALALERLGLGEQAAAGFAQLAGTAWEGEAAERAQRLREAAQGHAEPEPRRALLSLLATASTPAALEDARRALERLPHGAPDLEAIARQLTTLPLEGRAERWQRYLALRERAVSGKLEPAEADAFAAEPLVQGDPALWAPARQLAGFARQVRGDWADAARDDAALAAGCARRGCAAENEAVALDELADAAGRDGDFAAAHRLQETAEARFAAAGARLQLAELQRKRAALFIEEKRLPEAAAAAAASARALSLLPATPDGLAARANALAQAALVAQRQGLALAATELGEAALGLARQGGLDDLEVDLAALLADGAALAAPGGRERQEARARLEHELERLAARSHHMAEAALRARLAELLEQDGDAAGAVAEAARGLALAGAGSWSSDRLRLAVAHARGLRALGRDDEAARELGEAVAAAAASARSAPDPAALAGPATSAAAEVALSLARAGRPAEELGLPLDALRAAELGVTPAAAGWSRALAPGTCVLTALTGARFSVVSLVSREGGELHVLAEAGDALAALPAAALADRLLAGVAQRCPATGELWMMAAGPLDRVDLAALPFEGTLLGRARAVGVATTISRLLAEEPARPARALLVRDAAAPADLAGVAVALPGIARERAALAAVARVDELAGPAATVEAVLARAPSAALLHLSLHGFDGPGGGFLQLSGDPGRLGAAAIARLDLRARPRVVLSACEAASSGAGGLQRAFARAGALEIAAARGPVADGAAALWSERFYAALARGQSFARANREALSDPRAGWFVVMK